MPRRGESTVLHGGAGAAVDPRRVDVACEVVDADEWHSQRSRETLGDVYAYDQRAGESRPVCYGDGVDLFPFGPGLVERPSKNALYRQQVLPRRDFGDHSAEPGVQFRLRRHDVRQQTAVLVHQTRRRLVARRLYPKDLHFWFFG